MEIIEGLWRLDAGYEYPKITRSPCFCGVLDMTTERCWQAHSFVFSSFLPRGEFVLFLSYCLWRPV